MLRCWHSLSPASLTSLSTCPCGRWTSGMSLYIRNLNKDCFSSSLASALILARSLVSPPFLPIPNVLSSFDIYSSHSCSADIVFYLIIPMSCSAFGESEIFGSATPFAEEIHSTPLSSFFGLPLGGSPLCLSSLNILLLFIR